MRTSSRTRRCLFTAVLTGVALGALGAGSVCLAHSRPHPSKAWHGGWGSAKGWWGPGWWGTGQFISVLPWDYQSFWSQGKPYYFGGAAFYAWNGRVGKYEEVTPPIGFDQPHNRYVLMSHGIPKLSTRLYVYPEAKQSAAQQTRDQRTCYKHAAIKYTPHARHVVHTKPRPVKLAAHGHRRLARHASAPATPTKPPDTLALQHALLRAEASCLRKKHYAVR